VVSLLNREKVPFDKLRANGICVMDKPVQDKTMQAMPEEIRTRVFEKYAEIQGIQTQESELKATLEASA
jgi:hypothetical protein